LDCLAFSIWEEARHEIFSGIQACERAQSDMVLLRFIGMALDLMEREANSLVSTRRHGTAWSDRLNELKSSQRSGAFLRG
jgi:hypothetical protein